jgi:hypothetical protein
MHDATNTNEIQTSSHESAEADVHGYFIFVPNLSPMPSEAAVAFSSGPSVAPGHPIGAPAVPLAMRKAGGDTGKAGIIGVL